LVILEQNVAGCQSKGWLVWWVVSLVTNPNHNQWPFGLRPGR